MQGCLRFRSTGFGLRVHGQEVFEGMSVLCCMNFRRSECQDAVFDASWAWFAYNPAIVVSQPEL